MTGVTMWVVQPMVIRGLLRAADAAGADPDQPVVLLAKILSIGASVALNLLAYRFVVWRPAGVEPVRPSRLPLP
jgi:hypothetical protein